MIAEAIELTDAARFTLSLSGLVGLVAVITAWVTLRITVAHQGERLNKIEAANARAIEALERKIDLQDRRAASLERWRERSKGAAQARRDGDTDRILIRSSESSSEPYPRGER